MCGRFSFVATETQLQQQLPFLENTSNLRQSYNIAPTQHAYVITNDQPERLQYLTWGLIPYWANDGRNTGKLINARAEGIETKPSFRIPIRQRRCLVLADSFYEWRRQGTQKIPYRIFPADGSLLVMAGIWDLYENGDYPLKSFSIITCPPNELMATLHNRMPVVLTDAEQYRGWIDPTASLEETLGRLQTAPKDFLKYYRVSPSVNNVRNNGEELHELVEEDLDLFSQR